MCIGTPMQVVEAGSFHALCRDGRRLVRVDTTLVGPPSTGDWLLVFLGAARESLDESTALAMRDALEAVRRIMSGDHQVDHLFDDLIERRPQLPQHLQDPTQEA